MKKFFIDKFAAFMFSGMLWTRVKHVVEVLEKEDLSGNDKRHLAINELGVIGVDIAKFMVNLAIELAVAYIRAK